MQIVTSLMRQEISRAELERGSIKLETTDLNE
jgi:hypothetical protein